ncbi:helix-turn-helix domain-containing protein [Aestuariivirga sp.]|uniref:helix-turn-helix domain-containing protein n=1 Tax=Aestuariivirga sp. TaxID=2650926 RepID=UPI003BAC324F
MKKPLVPAPKTARSTATRKKAGKKGTPSPSRGRASDLAVGARLRAIREAAGLTQRELAKRAGVTNATVSLIEQEAHAPSLASLHRLLSAIPISIADFFALPVSQQNVLFYQAEDLAVVTRGAADLRVLGSERRDKKLQVFIERYQPGASTGDDPIAHDGETAAVVIRGTIEVEVDGRKNVLTTGGGYQLIGRQPYRLRNVGKVIAVVVCACTPAMF